MRFVIVALLAFIAIQGCATKTYGRQVAMTGHEKESMFCREIDLEVTKAREFIDQVNKESAFSGLEPVMNLSLLSLIPTLLPRGDGLFSLSLRERAGVRENNK